MYMMERSSKIFSDETVAAVQQTWKLMNADLQSVGADVLLRFFAKYPTYQSLFEAFKNVPADKLTTDELFLKHSLSVAKALNSAVESLDNPEKLVPALIQIGKAHIKRGITPEQFSNIQNVILEAIEFYTKDQCTDTTISAWNEVLAVAISTIMKGASV